MDGSTVSYWCNIVSQANAATLLGVVVSLGLLDYFLGEES